MKKPDVKADIKAAEDRGEQVSMMEPLVIEEGSRPRAELSDLVFELAQKSAGFRRSLPSSPHFSHWVGASERGL
jgi:hypothetical protein